MSGTPGAPEPNDANAAPNPTTSSADTQAPLAPPAPAPAPAPSQPRAHILERAPGWAVPVFFAVIVAGALVANEVSDEFYPNVVWQYYWGPIVADAWDCAALGHLQYDAAIARNMTDSRACTLVVPGGPGVLGASGYNTVNTASWAVLLGVCIFGIAQILRRTKTPMDGKLIVGASLWVVAGSVFHVMEDAHLFDPPVQYFFITPTIYLVFAAFGVLSLAIGVYLRNIQRQGGERGLGIALHKLLLLLAVPVLGYFYLWWNAESHVNHYVHPVWVALCMAAAYIPTALRFRRLGRIEPAELVGFMSIGWILLSFVYLAAYLDTPWWTKSNPHPVPEALWAIVLATIAATAAWVIGAHLLGRAENKGNAKRRDALAGFVQPMGWLILFAQTLDGFATAIGIDIGRVYSEKHVLGSAIIGWMRNLGNTTGWNALSDYPTFWGFATLKLALALFVVSVLYNPQGKDRQNPTITGLIAFAIIMVGLGPGVRNIVRMFLGI